MEFPSPKFRMTEQVPVPAGVPPTVKVIDWPTRVEGGLAVSEVISPVLTVMVGPVTTEGAHSAEVPSAVIVKLPAVVYVWLTVVVVFDRTVVDVPSPNLTVMGLLDTQLEELTVTETDWPTIIDVGEAVTDSAAQAALGLARKASSTPKKIFAQTFICFPQSADLPPRGWRTSPA